jgi:hypothetical protein
MKVKEIFEAQYAATPQKNSIEWFLHTFFDLEEIEQTDDDTFEATWYIKEDNFKAESADGEHIYTVIGEYKDRGDIEEPSWDPSKKTKWWIWGSGDQHHEVKDPRDLTIYFVKHAWPPAKRKINEAQYQDSGQGSLAWFIHHFFDHYADHEDYEGGLYKLKDGYEITSRDNKNIMWINMWQTPEGDYDWEFQDDRAHSASAGPNQVVVKKVKVLWDPSNKYGDDSRVYNMYSHLGR